MPKRTLEFFVIDLLIAIDKIKRYTADFDDKEDFLHDEKSFDATIRELEIVGEASRHLIKNQLLDEQWQIVVDFRNIITHEYFGIEIEEVWEVVKTHLSSFENEIHKLLSTLDQQALTKAVEGSISDFSYSRNTVSFLQSLKSKF